MFRVSRGSSFSLRLGRACNLPNRWMISFPNYDNPLSPSLLLLGISLDRRQTLKGHP